MRVIGREKLTEYWTKEPRTAQALRAWFAEVEHAKWKTPIDVKAKYGNASILKGNRVVFNICGNNYRLIVQVNYGIGLIFVRFIGTHAEYDGIDAETIL